MKTYHLGLVKQGERLVLEVADTVDGLNCELWRYCGERVNTLANRKRDRVKLLAAINADLDTQFKSLQVKRIASYDFSAGH
jgi:hypothetical protein